MVILNNNLQTPIAAAVPALILYRENFRIKAFALLFAKFTWVASGWTLNPGTIIAQEHFSLD
jgi:hypothetical protein